MFSRPLDSYCYLEELISSITRPTEPSPPHGLPLPSLTSLTSSLPFPLEHSSST